MVSSDNKDDGSKSRSPASKKPSDKDDSVEDGGKDDTSEVITPRPITPTFGYTNAPTHCRYRFVASRRVVETSLGGVSWGRLVGGGLWTSILFECCVCEGSDSDLSPREGLYGPVSRGESGLLHRVGGCILSGGTWE